MSLKTRFNKVILLIKNNTELQNNASKKLYNENHTLISDFHSVVPIKNSNLHYHYIMW